MMGVQHPSEGVSDALQMDKYEYAATPASAPDSQLPAGVSHYHSDMPPPPRMAIIVM